MSLEKTLEKLNKPYLLKPVKIGDLTIVYPKIDGYTFYNYFNIFFSESENIKHKVIKNIFEILCDLESSGYNHFDISPYNIMINKFNQVFLIDYDYLGTYGYIPPEKIKSNSVIFNKFDVYSFCSLIGEFIFRNKLFRITNFNKTCICSKECNDLQNCIDNQINILLDTIKILEIKNFYKILLSNGLILDPNKRKSFNEINQLLNNN